MQTNLEIAQDFVLGQYLSKYQTNLSYEENIDLLIIDELNIDENHRPLVTAWEPLEYCDMQLIMDNMVSAVERLLNEYRKDK